jgi:3-methyladenine DNA glycosylase AlkD
MRHDEATNAEGSSMPDGHDSHAASLYSDADEALIGAIRDGLASLADPARAPGMQAYMKSDLPYYGVSAPLQNRLFRSLFASHPLASFEQWYGTILTLWREARHREERYAAVALSGDRRYRAYQTMDALPLYEELIVTGAWWDLVDGLASHQVGGLLRSYPELMRGTMLGWSRDPDMWKRRSAILCQLGSKSFTDEKLLFDCIQANLADQQFFIRKGIGWALREYAKTDPDAVRRFLAEHWSELSPLSRREAEKHLSHQLQAETAL